MVEGLPEWVNTALGGLLGLGAGGYGVYRKLRADSAGDRLDGRAEAIIVRLEDQLKSERENAKTLGESIDRVARERNDAVKQVGLLEGTVKALEGEVSRLRSEIESLETKNTALTREITSLHGEVRNLSELVAKMLSQVETRMQEQSA